MRISASVRSSRAAHDVSVCTAAAARTLAVPARSPAGGSSINGGEFLMLALATCYCNDLYREAERRGIPLDAVEVEAAGEFDGVGLAARNVRYRARIASGRPQSETLQLLKETDAVAEVHNTLRAGVPVEWVAWDQAF
ncbi:MAG: OsmC family protein [Proteobacteria bacterium]|nr:OsmC family protein [Pseudomonadota bacterium]